MRVGRGVVVVAVAVFGVSCAPPNEAIPATTTEPAAMPTTSTTSDATRSPSPAPSTSTTSTTVVYQTPCVPGPLAAVFSRTSGCRGFQYGPGVRVRSPDTELILSTDGGMLVDLFDAPIGLQSLLHEWPDHPLGWLDDTRLLYRNAQGGFFSSDVFTLERRDIVIDDGGYRWVSPTGDGNTVLVSDPGLAYLRPRDRCGGDRRGLRVGGELPRSRFALSDTCLGADQRDQVGGRCCQCLQVVERCGRLFEPGERCDK